MMSITEELNLKFYLVLINLTLNSHMWLVPTILDSIALEQAQTPDDLAEKKEE